MVVEVPWGGAAAPLPWRLPISARVRFYGAQGRACGIVPGLSETLTRIFEIGRLPEDMEEDSRRRVIYVTI